MAGRGARLVQAPLAQHRPGHAHDGPDHLCDLGRVLVFSREQPFGEGVPTFGREFWAWWGWEYNVSLVADTFGVLLIVLLSKWLYEEGSAESNGDDGSQPASTV